MRFYWRGICVRVGVPRLLPQVFAICLRRKNTTRQEQGGTYLAPAAIARGRMSLVAYLFGRRAYLASSMWGHVPGPRGNRTRPQESGWVFVWSQGLSRIHKMFFVFLQFQRTKLQQ